MDLELQQSFWNLVQRTGPNDCWLWNGPTHHSGYGVFSRGKRTERRVKTAHRLAWILTHGDIPRGLLVCHRCDVRLCCNPAHLFLGTNRDNVNDMLRKGRSVGLKPGRSGRKPKLTGETAALVREMYASGGLSLKAIAATFGVADMTIHRLVSK